MVRLARCGILGLGALLVPLTLSAADWVGVLAKATPAVVRLEIRHEDASNGFCTALVINATHQKVDEVEGPFLLTAAHCVDKALMQKVDLAIEGHHATVVKANALLDLAVLRMDGGRKVALALAPALPALGEEVAILGFAFGMPEIAAQIGHVAKPYDRDERLTLLNVDTIFGDSGGAVLDGQGRCLGLVTTILSQGAAHLGGAVPVTVVREFVEKYLSTPAPIK